MSGPAGSTGGSNTASQIAECFAGQLNFEPCGRGDESDEGDAPGSAIESAWLLAWGRRLMLAYERGLRPGSDSIA